MPPLEGDGQELTGSLREVLKQHWADAGCASCHDRIDPLGFALENVDAVGRWCNRDGSTPVDATGELAKGRRIDGPWGLRAALKARAPEFRRCFAE